MRPLAFLLLSLAPGCALAGAWTQAPGGAFLSASTSYTRTESRSPFTEIEASLFGEIGVTQWLTIGATAVAREPVGVSSDSPAELEASLFARARLDVFADGDPLSAQVQLIRVFAKEPAGYRNDGAFSNLRWSPGAPDVDLRLLYGRGFTSALGGGWMDFQAGPRIRPGPESNEFRLDATFGLRPAEDWLVFAQSFNTFSLGSADYYLDNRHSSKLALSVGYQLTEDATIVLGVERQIWGWRSDPSTQVKLSVWRNFNLF